MFINVNFASKLIHTDFFGLNVILYYLAYSQHNTIVSFNPRILGHRNILSISEGTRISTPDMTHNSQRLQEVCRYT